MMFYVWPFAKSALKFMLVVGVQTLLVPVLTFALQGFWLQVGSRTNLFDAHLTYYRTQERAKVRQIDFIQSNLARIETARDRPLLEAR